MQSERLVGIWMHHLSIDCRTSAIQSCKRIPNISKDCRTRVYFSRRLPPACKRPSRETAGVGSIDTLTDGAYQESCIFRRDHMGQGFVEAKGSAIEGI